MFPRQLSNTLLLTSLLLVCAVSASAEVYYLSPNGNDDNPGTISQPWATLTHAGTQLAPGDTLYLRGGIYYYPAGDVGISLQGTEVSPIVIESYPGERARISGSLLDDFESAPNSEWDLVDASIQLYKSKDSISFNAGLLGGWLLDYDLQLINYQDLGTLTTTNYEAPNHYAGPGIHGSADGHIYIRLGQNPLDLVDFDGNPIPPILSDLNPNNHRISIFSSAALINLTGASHLKLRNLDIGPSNISIAISDPSHHIEIEDCRILYRNIAVRADTFGSHIEVHHNEITAGIPSWIYWDDVKEASQPASEMEGRAITGLWENGYIHHNVIRDGFDGIGLEEGTTNTLVTDNLIIRARDDAILLVPTIVNVEVARNTLRHCYGAISIAEEDNLAAPIGHVYIHHNILDNTWRHRVGRAGNIPSQDTELWVYDGAGNQWGSGISFGAHGCDGVLCNSAKWKVYNNTIISIQTGDYAKMNQRSIQNPAVYFYNNVFYNIGGGPVLLGDGTYEPSTGMHWDGNIFWRTTEGSNDFLQNFGGGSYPDLAAFLADPGTSPWERTNALQVNPGLNIGAIQQENYNLVAMWNLYRPTNPQVLTPGVSYKGLDWPGTEGVTYRGAIDQAAPQPCQIVCVAVLTNGTSYRAGDTLTASLQVDNLGGPGSADFYFGAVLPNGKTIILLTNMQLQMKKVSALDVTNWTPIAAGVSLAKPFTVNRPDFLSRTWVGQEPLGSYTIFLAAVVPGAFADGKVDGVDIIHSSFATVTFSR
jgi:hypothetical protein